VCPTGSVQSKKIGSESHWPLAEADNGKGSFPSTGLTTGPSGLVKAKTELRFKPGKKKNDFGRGPPEMWRKTRRYVATTISAKKQVSNKAGEIKKKLAPLLLATIIGKGDAFSGRARKEQKAVEKGGEVENWRTNQSLPTEGTKKPGSKRGVVITISQRGVGKQNKGEEVCRV